MRNIKKRFKKCCLVRRWKSCTLCSCCFILNFHSFIRNDLKRKQQATHFTSQLCSKFKIYLWSTMWAHYVITLKTRSRDQMNRCKFGTTSTLVCCVIKDKLCLFSKTENMKSWQRLQNCVKSPTHLSMWMQPRQLTPCDMLIFPAKWLYFSHSKLSRCPWHRRFEMVKSREESERDPARSVCRFAFRATVAL